jgi:hypothetical protein
MPTAETGTGATNDGTLDSKPYYKVGPLLQAFGYGWGTGLYGSSTWGTPRTTSNAVLDPGSWSLDNYGELLIATIKNGATFSWDPQMRFRYNYKSCNYRWSANKVCYEYGIR